MAKSLRRNPGWKLEPATIDIVAAARTATGKTAAQVIHAWAMAWQEGVAAKREGAASVVKMTEPDPAWDQSTAAEKPVAVRVETPYQIQRREKLEALRAKLANGDGAEVQQAEVVGPDAPVTPFEVMVGGEKHRVIDFKGRRVLEWIGPTSTVMKKNLTPQETVIYWHQRIKA